MLWSIDSCQNRVSADQDHLTVSRAQVSTHRGRYLFEVIRWQVTSFQMIAGSSLFFLIHMKYVVFWMCRTFKLTSEAKIQPVFTGREDMPFAFDFSHQGHALVTLYVQFLYSDWPKFDRWVHAQNLCSILNLLYFASWSWQSFVSTFVFNCLFSTECTKWNSAAIKSLLLFVASLLLGFLVEK